MTTEILRWSLKWKFFRATRSGSNWYFRWANWLQFVFFYCRKKWQMFFFFLFSFSVCCKFLYNSCLKLIILVKGNIKRKYHNYFRVWISINNVWYLYFGKKHTTGLCSMLYSRLSCHRKIDMIHFKSKITGDTIVGFVAAS